MGGARSTPGPEAQGLLPAETEIWICKPTASNQGKGIFLIRSQEEAAALQAKTQSIEDDPIYRKMPFRAPQARVVQRCGRGCQEGPGSQTSWCLLVGNSAAEKPSAIAGCSIQTTCLHI